MTKPTLSLKREKDGLWSYSYGASSGGTVKGQVAVTPGTTEAEKSAALGKIKAALDELSSHIIDDGQ